MLNELLIAERGARRAGIKMVQRHQDVKDAGKVPTLLVLLGANGDVESVKPVPSGARRWTIRDGKHNSFPFVQLQSEAPLWAIADGRRRAVLEDNNVAKKRAALLALVAEADPATEAFKNWPNPGLLSRLKERRKELAVLERTDAAVVPITFHRFLLASETKEGRQRLLETVVDQLVRGLQQSAQDDWLKLAVALLVGKPVKSTWKCGGALLFEAAGAQRSIIDPQLIGPVSEALKVAHDTGGDGHVIGTCALTGDRGPLFIEDFPEPNLKPLGETRIFSKNADIPANDRYGRFAAAAMPVGQDTAIRLAAALNALTADDLRGVTWRAVPGEAPKQNDLLLAFVESTPDAPVAEALAEDDEDDDFSKEAPGSAPDPVDSIAAFEKRTARLIEAVQTKVGANFRQTPVRLAVFRKVDLGNCKVVFAGAQAVGELHDAATGWAAGERNVPPWLTLRVFRKGEPFSMAPPHVAPLGVIAFSKQLFVRSGTERQEVVGVPAAEALGFFLDPIGTGIGAAGQRVGRVLRLLLVRRSALLAGVARIEHTPGSWSGRKKAIKAFEKLAYREALRTVTVLGVLLHKLGRTKEEYMSDTAFKLGQFLAAADVIHAGYCADIRGGDVPPSLLGNQVFSMAQTAPAKALAVLSRRWKPYDGWAKKAARERKAADTLVASKNQDDQRRGWDIRRALRHAREIGPLASELGGSLAGCMVDDTFRAELLLGYLAGLPKTQRGDTSDDDEAPKTPRLED